jgi:hypothetical protein
MFVVPVISKIILVKAGHGFSNNCPSFVSNHFLNAKINFREHFPHFAAMPKDFYACLTNCVGVFRAIGFVTHKSL